MSSINSTFNGPFKFQPKKDGDWETVPDSKVSTNCEKNPNTSEPQESENPFVIMDESVTPMYPNPIYAVDYYE